jgi:uncharacterized protein (DUF2141 family)
MKKSLLVTLSTTIVAIAFGIGAQSTNAADLTVEFRGLGDKGNVIAALFKRDDRWLEKPSIELTVAAKKEGASVTYKNLPAGEYAISMFVDENNNGKLDTNANGQPSEPFGFSNDVPANFGSPTFEQAKVVLGNSNRTISIFVQNQTLPTAPYPTVGQATGLFWNPQESGWGCNSIAQTNPRASNFGESKYILFLTCFIYDKSGRPVWIVVPDARDTSSTGKFIGLAYRTTSTGFGTSFNANAIGVFQVGSVEFDFAKMPDLGLTLRINDLTRVLEIIGTPDAQGMVTVMKRVQRQVWGVVEPTLTITQ